MWLFPYVAIHRLQSQSRGAPLPCSLLIASIHPCLCRAPAFDRRVGDQTAQASAHTQARSAGLAQCPGMRSQLAPGTAPLLQGKYPNKPAHRFLLLPPLPNENLKQDFSNHKVPPGRELWAGDFERRAERCPRDESCSPLSSSPADTSGVTTLGVVRSPGTTPGSSLR